ncbi:MAG: hypothetical protein PHG82_02340 [Candidatus Gracilibacteria bacterium]|nr:hypothetical protein [Candidatus Gracilibacteria bacterium]
MNKLIQLILGIIILLIFKHLFIDNKIQNNIIPTKTIMTNTGIKFE